MNCLFLKEYFPSFLDTNFEIKFPTECFFLTVQAQHLSLSAAIGQLKYLKRNLHEIEIGLTELKIQLRRLLALQIREKAMIEAKLERANMFRTVRFHSLNLNLMLCNTWYLKGQTENDKKTAFC